MAHDPEPVRFALEKVDRSKRFIAIAVVLLLVAVLLTYGALLHTASVGSDSGVSKAAFVAIGAQMGFVGVCAVLIAFHVTRMTKIVLNAIELATRK